MLETLWNGVEAPLIQSYKQAAGACICIHAGWRCSNYYNLYVIVFLVSSLYTIQITGKLLWSLWGFRLTLAKHSPLFVCISKHIYLNYSFIVLLYQLLLMGSVKARIYIGLKK